MKMDRDSAKRQAILLGARVTGAVSSKTTHLITGDNPGPEKMKKAREVNVKILNEEEFAAIIEKHSGKMDSPVEITSSRHVNAESTKPWAEKHRPQKIEDLVGNRGAVEQLVAFLDGKTSHKAALLSGSPGVGKTTAAIVVSRSLGYDVLEFNASDLRNKKMLNETVTKTLNSSPIIRKRGTGKHVLLMDEVDGMTADKNGIAELISIIKKTRIPVICTCNDKSHPKIKTLVNYCLDVPFRRLDGRTSLPRVKAILEAEGKKVPDGVINEVIAASAGDMRYILNTMQGIVSRDTISLNAVSKMVTVKIAQKGAFEIAAGLFQRKSIKEKIDLYFEDYSLLPLFVHENYLKCEFKTPKELLVAAESLSLSDTVDARIHGAEQEWSLMPYHAFFSCVYPLCGRQLNRRLDFPAYLGQNSKTMKNSRLLGVIARHLRQKLSRTTLRMYGMAVILDVFVGYLNSGEINKCLDVLVETELLKEDLLSVEEILESQQFKGVNAKTKTALTREYNKLKRRLPYTTVEAVEAADSE